MLINLKEFNMMKRKIEISTDAIQICSFLKRKRRADSRSSRGKEFSMYN